MRTGSVTGVIYTFLRLFVDGFRRCSIAQNYPWIGKIAAIIGAIVGCLFVIPFLIIKLSFDGISWLYIDCFLYPLKVCSLRLTTPLNPNSSLHKNHFAGHWFMLLLTPTYYLSIPVYYVLIFPLIILLITLLTVPELLFALLFAPIFVQNLTNLMFWLLVVIEFLFVIFHKIAISLIATSRYPTIGSYFSIIRFFGNLRNKGVETFIIIIQYILATLLTILACVCFYLPHKIFHFLCITWRGMSQSFDKKVALQRVVDQTNQCIEEKTREAINSNDPRHPTAIKTTICKVDILPSLKEKGIPRLTRLAAWSPIARGSCFIEEANALSPQAKTACPAATKKHCTPHGKNVQTVLAKKPYIPHMNEGVLRQAPDNPISVTKLNEAIQPNRSIDQLRRMVGWNEGTKELNRALKFYPHAHKITVINSNGTKNSLPKEIINILFEYITPFFEQSLFEVSMFPVNEKQSFFTRYDAEAYLYHDNYLNFLTITLYYGPQNAFRLFGLQIVACSLNNTKYYDNHLVRKDAIDTIEALYQLMDDRHMMPLPSSTQRNTSIPNWIVANGNGHPYTMKAAFRTRLTRSYFEESQYHYHLEENITWGWSSCHTACCLEQLEAIKQNVNPMERPYSSSSSFRRSLTLFFQRELHHDTSQPEEQPEEAMHQQHQFAKLLHKF